MDRVGSQVLEIQDPYGEHHEELHEKEKFQKNVISTVNQDSPLVKHDSLTLSSSQVLQKIDLILASDINFADITPAGSFENLSLFNEARSTNCQGHFGCEVLPVNNQQPSSTGNLNEPVLSDTFLTSSNSCRTFDLPVLDLSVVDNSNEIMFRKRKVILDNNQEALLSKRSSQNCETDFEDSLYTVPGSNTESFSELRFSTSETHSEFNYTDSDEESARDIEHSRQGHINSDMQKQGISFYPLQSIDDTTGILYEMSEQINKVPKLLSGSTKQKEFSASELSSVKFDTLSSSDDSLEVKVLRYFSQCEKLPLSGRYNSKGQEELGQLEEAVDRMLSQVELQESLLRQDPCFMPLVIQRKAVKALPLLVDSLNLSPLVKRRVAQKRSESDFLDLSKDTYLNMPSLIVNKSDKRYSADSCSISELERSVNRLLNEVEKEEEKLSFVCIDSERTTTSTDISSEDDSYKVWWEGAYRSLPRHSARKKLAKNSVNRQKLQQRRALSITPSSDDSDTSKESVKLVQNKTSHTKLMVKTVESGKSAVEIRTSNEFVKHNEEVSDPKFCQMFHRARSEAYSVWNRSLPSLVNSPPPSRNLLKRSLGSDDSMNYDKYFEPSECIQYFTPEASMEVDSRGYCTWTHRISVSGGPTSLQNSPNSRKENISVASKDEKESKYQFTMSVPDKQTFTKTVDSLQSFLEAEKNYNAQITITKQDKLSALADLDMNSSSETEESQSKSESEPKSDKSFVGKMSKKLFGVFKKDEKDKDERKKGKKNKMKKEKTSKKGLNNESSEKIESDELDDISHLTKTQNESKVITDPVKQYDTVKTQEKFNNENTTGNIVIEEIANINIGNESKAQKENKNTLQQNVDFKKGDEINKFNSLEEDCAASIKVTADDANSMLLCTAINERTLPSEVTDERLEELNRECSHDNTLSNTETENKIKPFNYSFVNVNPNFESGVDNTNMNTTGDGSTSLIYTDKVTSTTTTVISGTKIESEIADRPQTSKQPENRMVESNTTSYAQTTVSGNDTKCKDSASISDETVPNDHNLPKPENLVNLKGEILIAEESNAVGKNSQKTKTPENVIKSKKEKSKSFFGSLFNKSSDGSREEKAETSQITPEILSQDTSTDIKEPLVDDEKFDKKRGGPKSSVKSIERISIHIEEGVITNREEGSKEDIGDTYSPGIVPFQQKSPLENGSYVSVTDFENTTSVQKQEQSNTEREISQEVNAQVIKEKSKSFFGALFSKSQDVANKDKMPIVQPESLIPGKTEEITNENSIVGNKNKLKNDPTQSKIGDNSSGISTTLIQSTEETKQKAAIVVKNLKDELSTSTTHFEQILTEIGGESLQLNKVGIENSANILSSKEDSITDKCVSKFSDVRQESLSQFNGQSISISQSAQETKEKIGMVANDLKDEVVTKSNEFEKILTEKANQSFQLGKSEIEESTNALGLKAKSFADECVSKIADVKQESLSQIPSVDQSKSLLQSAKETTEKIGAVANDLEDEVVTKNNQFEQILTEKDDQSFQQGKFKIEESVCKISGISQESVSQTGNVDQSISLSQSAKETKAEIGTVVNDLKDEVVSKTNQFEQILTEKADTALQLGKVEFEESANAFGLKAKSLADECVSNIADASQESLSQIGNVGQSICLSQSAKETKEKMGTVANDLKNVVATKTNQFEQMLTEKADQPFQQGKVKIEKSANTVDLTAKSVADECVSKIADASQESLSQIGSFDQSISLSQCAKETKDKIDVVANDVKDKLVTKTNQFEKILTEKAEQPFQQGKVEIEKRANAFDLTAKSVADECVSQIADTSQESLSHIGRLLTKTNEIERILKENVDNSFQLGKVETEESANDFGLKAKTIADECVSKIADVSQESLSQISNVGQSVSLPQRAQETIKNTGIIANNLKDEVGIKINQFEQILTEQADQPIQQGKVDIEKCTDAFGLTAKSVADECNRKIADASQEPLNKIGNFVQLISLSQSALETKEKVGMVKKELEDEDVAKTTQLAQILTDKADQPLQLDKGEIEKYTNAFGQKAKAVSDECGSKIADISQESLSQIGNIDQSTSPLQSEKGNNMHLGEISGRSNPTNTSNIIEGNSVLIHTDPKENSSNSDKKESLLKDNTMDVNAIIGQSISDKNSSTKARDDQPNLIEEAIIISHSIVDGEMAQNNKKTNDDDKLNSILIDMLIEQECLKSSSDDKLSTKSQSPDSAALHEKHDTEESEKITKPTSVGFKPAASFGKVESLIGDADLRGADDVSVGSQSSYVTTPTMQRRKIGGSQRLSREERPALREVTHMTDYSSSEEDEGNYIVTEPSERQVTFQIDSEDESLCQVSDSSSEPELEVTEMTPSPVPSFKKQECTVEEKLEERLKSKIKDEKSAQKVERRFERMASETLEADPVVNFTADRDFQRMVSQLSSEEVDACLSQWDEGGLTPSEELDSTRDTVEGDGDLDPDIEALPEAFASSNPFYPDDSSWADFEQQMSKGPSSIFWAFDSAPTSVEIQPSELDIPIKSVHTKGKTLGDELPTNPNSFSLNVYEPPLRINTLGQSYPLTGLTTWGPCQLADSPLCRTRESGRQVTSEHGPTEDILPPKPTPTPSPKPKHGLSNETPDLPNEDIQDYSHKKKFWEQMSTSSQESQRSQEFATPPVPRPRSSIVSSVPLLKSEAESDTETTATTLSDSTVRINNLQQDAASKQSLTGSSDASDKEEGSDAEANKPKMLSNVTATTLPVASDTKDEQREKTESSDSESEYINKIGEEKLSFENSGFVCDDETTDKFPNELTKPAPVAATRLSHHERSVSLPTEDLLDVSVSSVRAKKRFFEAQIKKEMVVDQLMTQLEEDSSPEHKSFHHEPTDIPTSSPEAMVSRQIHSHIFSHELDEQIESLVPENKNITEERREIKTIVPTTVKEIATAFEKVDAKKVIKRTDSISYEAEVVQLKEENEQISGSVSEVYSSPPSNINDTKSVIEVQQETEPCDDGSRILIENNLLDLGPFDVLDSNSSFSAEVEEVIKYRSDSISKPSDSLEVHIDKSEIEETEKDLEIDEEIKHIEADLLKNMTSSLSQAVDELVPEITVTHSGKQRPESYSQGESEDTQSESDITPEDLRDKESVLKLQDWEQETIIPREHKIESTKETEISPDLKSHVHTPEEHIPDTVWEVPIQQEPETIEQEIVEDIPLGKQPIVEKDEDESQRSLTESCEIKSDAGRSQQDLSVDQHVSADTELSLTESALELKGLRDSDQMQVSNLTEAEARDIAKEIVSNIEEEISKRPELIKTFNENPLFTVQSAKVVENEVSDYIKKLTGKEDLEVKLIESVMAKKQREQIIKLSRTDTRTSSMEITDEDLRSSCAETDNSPLDSQGLRLCPVEDKSEDDTTEDYLNIEKELDDDLEKITEKEVLEKTLAEVKESLEAAQGELIEETMKKKEVLKKQSPSEFEFKVLALEKFADENIQECHVEEAGASIEMQGTAESKLSGVLSTNIKEQREATDELRTHIAEDVGFIKKDDKEIITDSKKVDYNKTSSNKQETVVEESVKIRTDVGELKTSQRGSASFSDDEEKSGHSKISQNVQFTSGIVISQVVSEDKEKESDKKVESYVFDSKEEKFLDGRHILREEFKKEDKKTEIQDEVTLTKEDLTCTSERENLITEQSIEKTKIVQTSKTETLEQSHSESKIETESHIILKSEDVENLVSQGLIPLIATNLDDEESVVVKVVQKEKVQRTYSEESQKSQDESIKSAAGMDDGISSSSSSGVKGDSDTMHTLDKPGVVLRKHKSGSSSSHKKGDRRSGADYEPYSSSGESYYQSFEQTSESIRTPSRPCSSDVEILMAGVGTTGSSEYESAISNEISGRSLTSYEYHTAVSSLSSRESMKSLDSESSGNLASVEISSEASETLVPSAMELERDMEGLTMGIIEEDGVKQAQILEPYEREIPHHIIKGESPPHIPSISDLKNYDQSISLDISSEGGVSEEDIDASVSISKEIEILDGSSRMKRSHEMTFQPEPLPLVSDSCIAESQTQSSLDDSASALSTSSISDSAAQNTVIERSRTESERMDGSATSDQLSLTVSGTSELLSISSESQEAIVPSLQSSVKQETVSTQLSSHEKQVDSVTIITSNVLSEGIQSVSTQVTSETDRPQKKSNEISDDRHICSNGPTQVEYNAEYDDVKEIKKRPGHRRTESAYIKPSAIPVLKKRVESETVTNKSHDNDEMAESDKYQDQQLITSKEDRNDEKKDVDEAEKIDDESYHTEADQGFHREMREARQLEDMSSLEEEHELQGLEESRPQSQISKSDSEGGYRPVSSGFSDDRPDSELAELLKHCSSDAGSEDPIERPKTPEPLDECEIKDDTPEFSSEAQASVTELELEYSGAFSRTVEYESHISPIREKVGQLWESPSSDHEEELAESEAAFHMVPHVTPHLTSVYPDTILEDPAAEKHELETREIALKEIIRKRAAQAESTSPGYIPDITITQHMTPLVDRAFHYPDLELEESIAKAPSPQTPASVSSRASSETESDQGREYVLEEEVRDDFISEEPDIGDVSVTTEEKTVFESKDEVPGRDSATDSPNSDSFEMLEKPDITDDFVIIEEVGKEAHEQDKEGKSVKIGKKRIIKKVDDEDDVVISPPAPVTRMTDIKYYPSGGAPFPFETDSPPTNVDGIQSSDATSQEGSPPSDVEHEYENEVEAGKKWIEMQFQGDQATAVYGYELDYERGPLEDIKEEPDLESSSRIGSVGSQVSQSVGSFGSIKESFGSTPDYDVLAGRKYFTRSGDHDDVSMSSLQEFERLETLINMEINKNRSSGSQDSLNSSGNSKKQTGSGKSGGDDLSLASLKEFEGLEHACIEAARIELKAKEEEMLLSEIEEGHESQASESESCETISVGLKDGDSDEEDYEKRMFEIDEIIRQAQTNVERFVDEKSKEILTESSVVERTESMGRGDSIEEVSKIPDLDLDQPLSSLAATSKSSYVSKSALQNWRDKEDDRRTSTDSLELKHGNSSKMTASTDSLEVKHVGEGELMSASTDSIEFQAQQNKLKAKDIMTDSIEIIGDKTSMLTSTDSLETDPPKLFSDSIEEEDGGQVTGPLDQSSSSGKGDWSSGREDGLETNRMPPPRAELLLGSTDSLEPTSSTATHATYHYETDSVMSSSFTSGGSNTMMSSTETIDQAARAGVWFDDGKPYVTEVIEPDDEGGFTHTIHRTVEMPPEIHNVSFRGPDAERALKEYIERFGVGEDMTETQTVDEAGNVHTTRVVQRRVIMRPDEFGGPTTRLTEAELEEYLKKFSEEQDQTGGSQCSSSPSQSSEIHQPSVTRQIISPIPKQDLTSTQVKGDSTEEASKSQEQSAARARPQLKYDISMDEEPEVDMREHDWRFNLPVHHEGEEALLDLAAGLKDTKGSGAGSGPSSAK